MNQLQPLVGDPRTNVISGHDNIYVEIYWQSRARVVREVSLRLSCQDAADDMQHDLPRSFIIHYQTCSFNLASGQIFKLTDRFQIHVSMRLSVVDDGVDFLERSDF